MTIKGNAVGYPLPDPQNGLAMHGGINMNGQKLNGIKIPEADDEAATKQYVDTVVKGKLTTHVVTLPASGWTDNLQTVNVPGVTADKTKTDVFASADPADSNYAAYNENAVHLYAQMDGAVQFKCEEVPDIDLTVNVMVRV